MRILLKKIVNNIDEISLVSIKQIVCLTSRAEMTCRSTIARNNHGFYLYSFCKFVPKSINCHQVIKLQIPMHTMTESSGKVILLSEFFSFSITRNKPDIRLIKIQYLALHKKNLIFGSRRSGQFYISGLSKNKTLILIY